MTQKNVVTTASVQMLPAEGDSEANIKRATRLVKEAANEHGAELIILPECTLTGYTRVNDAGPSLATSRSVTESVPGPSTEHFAKLADDLNVHIIWGLHEKRDEHFYNSAVLLSPDGTIMGTYSKVHINKYEASMGWTNGEKFQVWPIQTQRAKFNLGIMICFDREVPEAARCLTMLGADVIAVPQATSCTCRSPIHRDLIRVRAFENEVFIAMANWGGPRFEGHSMIVSPNGEVLRLGSYDEEILVVDLDLDALKRHREQGIYGKHHRQPKTYGPLLKS